MKKLLFLFLVVSLCSCGGKKKFKVGEYTTTSHGKTETGVIYNGSVVIDDDNINLILDKETRVDVDKLNILDKSETWDKTEYHFVDEDGKTGSVTVDRFR